MLAGSEETIDTNLAEKIEQVFNIIPQEINERELQLPSLKGFEALSLEINISPPQPINVETNYTKTLDHFQHKAGIISNYKVDSPITSKPFFKQSNQYGDIDFDRTNVVGKFASERFDIDQSAYDVVSSGDIIKRGFSQVAIPIAKDLILKKRIDAGNVLSKKEEDDDSFMEFALGKDALEESELKAMQMSYAQHAAGLLTSNITPKLYEIGLDYSIVERVDTSNPILKEVADYFYMEHFNDFQGRISERTKEQQEEFDRQKLLAVRDMDRRFGMNFAPTISKYLSTTNINDLYKADNLGVDSEGNIVMIDLGTLGLTADPLKENKGYYLDDDLQTMTEKNTPSEKLQEVTKILFSKHRIRETVMETFRVISDEGDIIDEKQMDFKNKFLKAFYGDNLHFLDSLNIAGQLDHFLVDIGEGDIPNLDRFRDLVDKISNDIAPILGDVNKKLDNFYRDIAGGYMIQNRDQYYNRYTTTAGRFHKELKEILAIKQQNFLRDNEGQLDFRKMIQFKQQGGDMSDIIDDIPEFLEDTIDISASGIDVKSQTSVHMGTNMLKKKFNVYTELARQFLAQTDIEVKYNYLDNQFFDRRGTISDARINDLIENHTSEVMNWWIEQVGEHLRSNIA